MSNTEKPVSIHLGSTEIRVRGEKISIVCTRCEGSGFLNVDQVPLLVRADDAASIMRWLEGRNNMLTGLGGCSCSTSPHPPCGWCEEQHDVQVCDCCGDGEGHYGIPGEHYNPEDPMGEKGPYASNGGLAQCH